jgi:outer membrane lipoprotein carrier protein
VLLALALSGWSAGAQSPAVRPTIADTTVLDRAAQSYASSRTIRATFEQTLAPPGGTVRSAKGEYLQQGSAKFAFRFSEPAGDVIVCDGADLWLYLPSSAKGQVLKMPAQMAGGFSLLEQLLSKPRQQYIVTPRADSVIGDHAVAVFALAPRNPRAPFQRAVVWIGKADALLWRMETVEPSGLVRRVTFSSIRPNATIPASAFTFTPPAGVKIVDQAALMGGKP